MKTIDTEVLQKLIFFIPTSSSTKDKNLSINFYKYPIWLMLLIVSGFIKILSKFVHIPTYQEINVISHEELENKVINLQKELQNNNKNNKYKALLIVNSEISNIYNYASYQKYSNFLKSFIIYIFFYNTIPFNKNFITILYSISSFLVGLMIILFYSLLISLYVSYIIVFKWFFLLLLLFWFIASNHSILTFNFNSLLKYTKRTIEMENINNHFFAYTSFYFVTKTNFESKSINYFFSNENISFNNDNVTKIENVISMVFFIIFATYIISVNG